ncbi:MAG: DUF2723 domain-containing protein [Saprospiraceae bacterium]|nr:DUF2723 domain-containing protein [Saprospiraceae bacterium]
MNILKSKVNITGWLVFLITFAVYFFSVERTGSLWDCGEFVLGAYKLQVVHPPGAPLFLLVGRLFAWLASLFSNNPADIAFAVNLMSGICSAFAATFICWTTIMFSKLAVYGRDRDEEASHDIGILSSGLIAGLCTAFATSIWFSAVEGEVYSMSTMFTCLTLWAAVKWYYLPNDPKNDSWLIFSIYAAALSVGVHLLSLLAFPTIALLYYYKRWDKHTTLGFFITGAIGVISVVLFQSLIISGIPALWSKFEIFCVNTLGLPFHSGLIPTLITLGGLCYWALKYTQKIGNDLAHKLVFSFMLIIIANSVVGMVMLRAIANPPINMNAPSDVVRLLPYLNREQYGDRSLTKGPVFDARPIDNTTEDRYGRVGNEYKVVDRKFDYVFAKKDQILIPRISHGDQNRPLIYRQWMEYLTGKKDGFPTQEFNIKFMFSYQFGWMFWRYFMWNFVGRENAEQGYYPWDKKDGHWLSGIKAIDGARLYNQDQLPRAIREDQSRNTYYFIPLLFGILGVIFHYKRNKNDFLAIFAMWLLTGLGLCFFNNSPPNEPRERDYVLVGAIFTFCIWIGMGVLFISQLLREKIKLSDGISQWIATALVISAPLLMGFQNFNDHSRNGITAARDYAINILESVKPNGIIFTYGDNDTYPVWYSQEVEGIRRDVRVINLSLIAVDWYIESQRRKINESAPVKLSIPSNQLRGFLRNQVYYYNPAGEGAPDVEMSATQFLKFIGEDHKLSAGGGREIETYMPTRKVYIEVNRQKAIDLGMITATDTTFVDKIPVAVPEYYITKDDLAVLDIINSNINERPVYFSVTCQQDKLLGLSDYTNMEGLALRIVPIKSPSERAYQIYGSGKIDDDRCFDLVMNKFKWGNFDKQKLFVDHSYAPSVQGMRFLMMRMITSYGMKGDSIKAGEIAEKYFNVFPNMNFPYDSRVLPFLESLIRGNKKERAVTEMKTMISETADWLKFYNSLSAQELETSYKEEKRYAVSSIYELTQLAEILGDESIKQEVKDKLGPYQAAPSPN